jgi:SH3 domain protein
MMLKLRLIGLTLLAFSAATAVHAEEKRYVSDELNTWVRTGPGDNYRLVGTVNAGEEVSLLQTNADTSYGQVRDSSGLLDILDLLAHLLNQHFQLDGRVGHF